MSTPQHFIYKIISQDVAEKRNGGKVVTRFPPEPNGYLHIGHAKAICLNFDMARTFGGRCHLRLDDTNPETEETHYAKAIEEDVRWLGFQWDALHHTSDYFDELYRFALTLIDNGDAYVCDLNTDEIRQTRGTLTEPGADSPYRTRKTHENRNLFERMQAGEFSDGERVLRAKIDMASPNINMRDPVLYRIRHAVHPRLNRRWHIYPTYDYAHCLSDAIEGITHSLCTLEFEDHRPLYDWILEHLPVHRSRQYEFARLTLKHTITSKRKLKQLVEADVVDGWDDPRMPTLSGLRRRGFPPAAIRNFCSRVGLTKNDSIIETELLETCVRDYLNDHAPRAFAVLNPLKVIVENYPEGQSETITAPNHPQHPEFGTRTLPFARELYIDRDDFMEDPPGKYRRLAPEREVRFKYAYLLRCVGVVKDNNGQVIEVRCVYDPDSTGGKSPDGRKVKGTIHWLAADSAEPITARLYDRLFLDGHPEDHNEPGTSGNSMGHMIARINPDSLITVDTGYTEPGLAEDIGVVRQFERLGYFCLDRDSQSNNMPDKPVFNRTITLRDTWAKISTKD